MSKMEICYYDPYVYNDAGVQSDVKPLAEDPRCLFGWGPPDVKGCECYFGHGCVRQLGHRGKCWDGMSDQTPPCSRKQRPSDWDSRQREECNR